MKASALRREIIGIKQHKREAFHTYWERFKKICARCPKHGITEYQVLQYFIEGMTPMEIRLPNASRGGSLPNKTPTEIRNLIKNMAEDSKHSSHDEEWYMDAPRGVKEVQTTQIEAQLSELTKVVMMLAKDKGRLSTKSYTSIPKKTTISSKSTKTTFSTSKFPAKASTTTTSTSGFIKHTLEDIVKSLATSAQSFQKETKSSLKSLEQQVSQLAQSVSKMESQGKLPSQTEKNPKHNACAITIRGGKSYDGPKMSGEEEEEKEIEVEEAIKEEERKNTSKSKKPIETEEKVKPAPFPSRLTSTKREREDDKIMAIFQKFKINIPFLDAMKQILRYAKFL
ncbi:hypothetical protein Lser_V15G23699 [Lactuca serriola]